MTQIDTHTGILADQRVREWFVRQKINIEADRRDAELRPIPERSVVTISRQYGSGGHTVASLLAAKLGEPWQVWDREIVDAVTEDAQMQREMVEALDERSQTLVDHILNSIANRNPLSQERFHRALVNVLLSIARQGSTIIIGRGANFVLPQGLNVRLTASTDFRIRAIERREHLSYIAAEAKLHKIDSERAIYVRSLFARDINDQSAYDLILRMDGISPHTAADAIAAAIEQHRNEGKIH